MKLLRYGEKGQEKPGIIDADGKIRDLSGIIPGITADTLSPEGLKELRQINPLTLPLVKGNPRIGACIAKPESIIGIGLNYKEHVTESGAAMPTVPVKFLKATSSLNGPNDNIVIPNINGKDCQKTDHEVELAVIIGKEVPHGVSEEEALRYVAGYTIANDVSERQIQIKDNAGNWSGGKSFDTFTPLGPYFITADEVPDPQKLQLTCKVNSKLLQKGNTGDMVFSVAEIISHLSQFQTLKPGDVILTGTPPGVALGGDPDFAKPERVFTEEQTSRRYLKPGDTLELGITGEGIDFGKQNAKVVAHEKSGSFLPTPPDCAVR